METILKLSNGKEVNFTRVNNDINGNPRYVCHFWDIHDDYDNALNKSKAFGGKMYLSDKYGGGIVFQYCDLNELKPLFE